MSSLVDLEFSDLYVPLESPGVVARYNPSPSMGGDKHGNLPIPDEYDEEVATLAAMLGKGDGKDFAITYPQGAEPNTPGSMRLRVSKQMMLDGRFWCCCRRFSGEVRKLEELGFLPQDYQTMSGWSGARGLVIIGGATGDGKTTTAASLLKHFVAKTGLVAFTIEDPVEYVLKVDEADKGAFYQMQAHDDVEWAEGIKTALRFKPRFIFVGEIRTAAAAAQLIQAACSGHLVICTIHGGSVQETLSRLIQIASDEMGDTARNLLADSLVAVMHQRLVNGRPQVYMLTTDGDGGSGVRAAIRDNKIEQLGSDLKRQEVLRKQAVRPGAPGTPGGPTISAPASASVPRQAAPVATARAPAPPPKKKGFLGGIFG